MTGDDVGDESDGDVDPNGSDDSDGETNTVVITLSVPEMDCPSCAGKVDNALRNVDGVRSADLRPTAGTATVTYDPDQIDRDDVVAAVERAGYEVVDDGRADAGTPDVEARGIAGPGGSSASGARIAPPAEIWTSRRAIKTWIGAVFLAGGLLLEFVLVDWNSVIVLTPLGGLTAADTALLVAVLTSGLPVVRSGYYSARNRSLDIDLLMGTAIVAATAIGFYIEAATLAVLFSIAELLERYAMDQTRDSLRELMELAPEEATVIRRGGGDVEETAGGGAVEETTSETVDRVELTVPVDEIEVGDVVAVRPGEKIPVDGVVLAGTSAVDQSPITGESVPVDKAQGEEVFAGTLNESGYLEIEATTDAAGTTLSRIIDLVGAAQSQTTETEQFVDRFAGYYTPIVVVLAILTAALPPVLIDGSATLGLAGYSHTFLGDWRTWFVRGLTLLVIACPCAFVISTPVSVASGLTSAARNGVLIKGGNHLEAMGEVDAVAFDKTGTLTKGELAVTDVVPFGDASESELLGYAAALERRSEHPIADAIRVRAEGADVGSPDVSAFESIAGKGVRATVDGTTYYAGNPGLFAELGIDLGDPGSIPDGGLSDPVPDDDGLSDSVAEDDGRSNSITEDDEDSRVSGPEDRGNVITTLQRAGKTVVLVGTEDRLLGVVGIADEVRPEAKRAVENLHRLGVAPLVMLTGDNEGTARAVAAELGVDESRAELLPDEKVEAVRQLQAEYGSVAMVGDGINDAPALATADVGIAMGAAGTDTAIETADIALMGDDIGTLPYLYALSRKANSVIRQNIWASLGAKLLLAIGVPFGYVSVALAVVVGDMGMSLGVTGNAMRLSRMTPERFLDR